MVSNADYPRDVAGGLRLDFMLLDSIQYQRGTLPTLDFTTSDCYSVGEGGGRGKRVSRIHEDQIERFAHYVSHFAWKRTMV